MYLIKFGSKINLTFKSIQLQRQIQLNIIPFTPVASKGTFSFYGEKQKGFVPIYLGKIMVTFPEGREARYKNYYTDFQEPREGAITKEINLPML